MNEALLHFIWLYQYYDRESLVTTEQEHLNVLRQGTMNPDAGPDFLNARIVIGTIEWNGHVEIHVRSSEWNRHGHQKDDAYRNVILHVVWEHDEEITHPDGTPIPTLTLKKLVSDELLKAHKELMHSRHAVPCSMSLHHVPEIIHFTCLEQAVTTRLESKANLVKAMWEENNHDWDETAYQLLAKNFGFKVNSDSLLQLAHQMPHRILKKHFSDQLQVDALLFGQAGMLISGSKDEYPNQLFKEYQFLKHKYGLETTIIPSQWKFMRLRPANFPTLRIAQFSAFLFSHQNLFSSLINIKNMKEVFRLFTFKTGVYWTTHYRFGKKAAKKVSKFGKDAVNNIMINTIVPLWVAYGKERDDQMFVDRALSLLQEIAPENNKIIRIFQEVGWKATNAFDSQGMVELFNNLCQQKACLNCAVGNFLMKPK